MPNLNNKETKTNKATETYESITEDLTLCYKVPEREGKESKAEKMYLKGQWLKISQMCKRYKPTDLRN